MQHEIDWDDLRTLISVARAGSLAKKVVRLPSRICRLSVAAMDALLALVRDRPAAFTTQPISREFDEAGVKRDRRWLEELREREHLRNRPTRLLRPIRLRRIADGNEECRDLIIAETKLT